MSISAGKPDIAAKRLFFRASAFDFKNIPDTPIAYWVGESTLNGFKKFDSLGSMLKVKQGLATTDNNRFIRFWYEIKFPDLNRYALSRKGAEESKYKWFPIDKGGGFRKWYGNNDSIVNWENDGREIKANINQKYPYLKGNPDFVAKNSNEYFKPGITWGKVTSGAFSCRFSDRGSIFSDAGMKVIIEDESISYYLGMLSSKCFSHFLSCLSETLNFEAGNIARIPTHPAFALASVTLLLNLSKADWDSYETSWDFTTLPLLHSDYGHKLQGSYEQLRAQWQENTLEMQRLEEENNRIFIEAYGLDDELTPDVPLNEITLTCNPHYRYRLGKQWDDASEVERNAELERQLQSDTICELISYIIGCMMGRYSIDQPGLILASQGETLKDYLQRVPNPRFMPDDDAIVPLTDQEWFGDDATHRVREFVRTVWGEQHLQENLDFIAESLCLSAMRPRKGESSLDCIRRYLSTQFYKDHMRTYKKRPIYWLFSSGKLKAFECLVYLHRYNEGTLARMRTEYVIPLTAKLHSYTERLENEKANSTSTADTRRLEKEIDQLHKQQAELAAFDEQLRDFADQRIQLDLDDGVKVNYGKFGNLLSEVKSITGA